MVMKMKDALKCFGLLAVGLLTAIFLYPFLHELGHTCAAIIFGRQVCDFRLFPVPSVMCEMDITNEFAIIVVGFSGMLLPYLLSLILPRKHFWVWFLWLIISGICLLSFAVSIAGIFLYVSGSPMANEDITQIMKFADEYYVLYLATLIVLSVIRSVQIVHSKPIKRCMKYFGV